MRSLTSTVASLALLVLIGNGYAADPVTIPPAHIEASGRTAVPLTGERLPDYLTGATIYLREKKPGEDAVAAGRTDLTILKPGVVFLQANFKKDGSAQAPWKSELKTLDELRQAGWTHLGPCAWAPGEELLARVVKAGDVFQIRIAKYNGPKPILPARPIPTAVLRSPKEDAAVAGPVTSEELPQVSAREARLRDKTAWLALLDSEDFDELERSIADLRQTPMHYRDGSSRLIHFYRTVGPMPRGDDIREQEHLRRIARLEAWLTAHPKSSAAGVALAGAWLQYGWFARGYGFIDTVTDADTQRLRERARRAADLLDEVAKLPTPLDCGYYDLRIDVSLGLSEKPERAWVAAALKLDPLCREVVAQMSRALLPRWFGEPGELEKFTAETAEATKRFAGDLHYATVAVLLWDYYVSAAFETHPLDWKRVRQGFRDRERLFPTSQEHRNVFAALAILARDFETAREQFDHIGDDVDLHVWGERASFDNWKLHVAADLFEGSQQQLISAHEAFIVAMTLSPDGKTVVSTDQSDRVRVHELATGKRRLTMTIAGIRAQTVTLSSRISLLAAAAENEPGVYLMNLLSGQETLLPQGRRQTTQVAIAPDGKLLAAADDSGRITLFRLEDASIQHDLTSPSERPVRQLLFSPNSRQLALASEKGLVQIYSVETGKLVDEWVVSEAPVLTLAWSPAGNRLAVADREATVHVFDLPGHKPRVSWKAPIPFPSSLDFSPDGKRLAVGRCGRQYNGRLENPLRVWNYLTDREPKPLNGHKLGVRNVTFTPDGRRLVSASYDWTIRVWDVTKSP